MKIWLTIKKTLTLGCVLYTVLLTGAYIIGTAVNPENLLTLQAVLGLLAFSFTLAASFVFLFSGVLNAPVRVILHFAVSLLAFYFIFLRLGGYLRDGGSTPKMLLVFTLVYVIVGTVVFLVRRLTGAASKKQKPEAYETIFSDKSGDRGSFPKGGRRP